MENPLSEGFSCVIMRMLRKKHALPFGVGALMGKRRSKPDFDADPARGNVSCEAVRKILTKRR